MPETQDQELRIQEQETAQEHDPGDQLQDTAHEQDPCDQLQDTAQEQDPGDQLTRFSKKPTLEHWQSLMHVCRYIFHTRELGITFGKDTGLKLYTDSDFANCPISSKSTSGFVATLAGGAVAWSSRRQSITAQSSTEAEYIAANHAVMESDHLRKVLWSCGLQVTPVNILCDNNGAIAQAKGINTTDKRMKHVAIRYNLVRDKINRGDLTISYIPGTSNVADCMTKAVKPSILKMATQGMGMLHEDTKGVAEDSGEDEE